MKIVVFVISLVLLTCVETYAQRNFTTTAQVQVVSSKDTTSTSLKSDIEKELGSFVDVSIKEKDADYSVIVWLEKIPSNGPAYFALTFAYFKNAECSYKNAIVDGKVLRTDCRALAQLSTIGFLAEGDLKAKAKEIVSSFDKSVLDPDRKAFGKNRSL